MYRTHLHNSVRKSWRKPRERIFDICAAPGGKSFTIAQMMQNSGELLSFDLYTHRTALIQEGAKRLGIDNLVCKS